MKKILRIFANFSSMAILATVLAFGLMVAGCPSGGDDEKEALTGSVTIGGTAQVGQTLMANTNSLGGSGAITYQWLRGRTEPIGANQDTYQVAAADEGKTITVRVTRADNTGYVDSAPTGAVSGTPNASFTITFNQIADAAPAITGPTLYRVSHTGPTTETLTVENPAQYDSIAWRVQDGATTAGTDASFTLNAANTGYNLIGEHFVTLEVVKDGVTYNKTISFTVAY